MWTIQIQTVEKHGKLNKSMCHYCRQLLTFGTPSAWSPSQTQESGFFRHRKTPPGHTPVDTGMQEMCIHHLLT